MDDEGDWGNAPSTCQDRRSIGHSIIGVRGWEGVQKEKRESAVPLGGASRKVECPLFRDRILGLRFGVDRGVCGDH